jgi:hypothetical protein
MSHLLIEEVMMKHVRITARRIAFVLSLIVLPLTALVCSTGLPELQGKATDTALPGGVSVPTSPGGGAGLHVSWGGSYNPPTGSVSVTYGPDATTIPLVLSGGTYAGSFEGEWHASVTGACTATGHPPVTFDVMATAGQSGDLNFTVERTIIWTWDTVCPGVSGGSTSKPQAYIYTFTLPSQNGASKTFSEGGPTWKFVLTK